VSYDVTDTQGATVAQTETVTITGTNDAPVIQTDKLSVSENGDGTTTVFGLYVTDSDAGASISVTAVPASAGTTGSFVNPSNAFGTLAEVNGLLSSITYDEGSGSQLTDMVTFTASDGSASDSVNFIFKVAGSSGLNTTTLATSGKDVIFSTAQADVLAGGAGADQFVFAAQIGNDTITDFASGQDKIDLLASHPFTSGDSFRSIHGSTVFRSRRTAWTRRYISMQATAYCCRTSPRRTCK
jgi:hypothetical protein